MNVEEVAQRGLRVVSVFDGSPAQRGGVKAGDVITKVDGRSIAGLSTDEATTLIKGRAGTRVVLTVVAARDPARTRPAARARASTCRWCESEMRTVGRDEGRARAASARSRPAPTARSGTRVDAC